MKGISITKKLIAYFLLFCIGAVIIVSLYSYYNAKTALLNRTFDQLTSLRIAKKNQLSSFFNDRITDIKILSNSIDIQNLLYLFNKHPEQLGSDVNGPVKNSLLSECTLLKYLFNNNYYERLLLCNKEGKSLVAVTNPGNSQQAITFGNLPSCLPKSVLEKALKTGKEWVSDFCFPPGSGKPVILIIHAVGFKDREPEGIAILELSLNAIDAIMLEENPHNGLGKSGESYLVGEDLLMRSSSRFHKSSVMKTVVNTDAVKEAFLDRPGNRVILEYRNIEVLSSYSRLGLPGLNWVIVAEIDFAEAMVPIYAIRNNIALISLLILIALLMVVYLVSKSLTKPIILLRNAADKVGKGDLNAGLEIKSNDEIGDLTLSFNKMIARIKMHEEELEAEKKKSMGAMFDGEETERQRLSRELHDGLGQDIVALKLKLESPEFGDSEKSKVLLNDARKSLDRIIDEIRRISYDLMPAGLMEFGIEAAMRNLCESISVHSSINIMFDSQNIPGELTKIQKTYIFRITQEALSNVVRHSQAKEAAVNFYCENNLLCLIIEDNGKGFYYNEKSHDWGIGIYNLNERVGILNGKIDIKSKLNKGTIITISIPLA